ISPPDLPTVLNIDERDRYRRIFQAQASSQWSAADAEIAQLADKTLLGYVNAPRLLATGYQATYEQLAAWLRDYNDHPDAPPIYKLPVTRKRQGSAHPTPPTL